MKLFIILTVGFFTTLLLEILITTVREWHITSTIPLWVRVVYTTCERIESFFDRIRPQFMWRYQLMDDSCGCEHCEHRRAKGYQGPRKYGTRVTPPEDAPK